MTIRTTLGGMTTPRVEPQAIAAPSYVGDVWEAFDPVAVQVVQATDRVDEFVLVDLEGGDRIVRLPGKDVSRDARQVATTTTMAPMVKALKTLQDNLGEIQDLQVQMHSLRQISQQMADEAEVAVDTLMAIGMLVEALDERQRRARAAFRKRFASFATPANHDLFKTLFAQSPAQQASGS